VAKESFQIGKLLGLKAIANQRAAQVKITRSLKKMKKIKKGRAQSM